MEVPRVGRKWGMVLSSALMGVALALVSTYTPTPLADHSSRSQYQLVDSVAASVGFNAME